MTVMIVLLVIGILFFGLIGWSLCRMSADCDAREYGTKPAAAPLNKYEPAFYGESFAATHSA